MQAILGIAVLTAILWALSTQRKSTAWHTVLGALGLQFALAILVLKVPFVKDVFTWVAELFVVLIGYTCLLYTSPSPRDGLLSRMPSSA